MLCFTTKIEQTGIIALRTLGQMLLNL